jgi:hypothetical protein
MTGYFVPATTADYIFYYSVDNDGWLYLSSDESPANEVMIAADVGWQNDRIWTGPGGATANAGTLTATFRRGVNPDDSVKATNGFNYVGPFENRSDEFLTSPRAVNAGGNRPYADVKTWPTVDANGNAKITLTAGKRYLITSYHSEPEGGHAEMTFKLAGQPDPVNGVVSRLTGNLIGALVDPSSVPPIITRPPTNIDYTIGSTITLTVVADSALPPTYQWNRNGTAIAGQTNSTLTIANAGVANAGSYTVAVVNANGTATSTAAVAFPTQSAPGKTFTQDSTGLVVMEAESYFATTRAPDAHGWLRDSVRADSSGGAYMQAAPDAANASPAQTPAGLATSTRLDFKVVFTKTGTNYLWIRGGDPTAGGAGDSVYAGLDGTSVLGGDVRGAPGFNTTAWNWVGNDNAANTRAFLVVTNAGEHTVSLWMREDGFLVDKLLLTTDAAFTPTGQGPAETGGGGGAPTISAAKNATGGLVITYTGTLESSATANGPYTAVTGATSPYTPNLATAAQQFYRARQ